MTSTMVEKIKLDLEAFIEPEKAAFYPRFFQTGEGEYAEGDQFIGVRVPNQRKIAKKYYKAVSLRDIEQLLHSPIHEYRSVALIMLVYRYQKATPSDQEEIVRFYLENLNFVNNWDLVDVSADKILGAFLFDKDRKILYTLAKTGHLWRQRVAVIATFDFIRHGDFRDTLALAELFLRHDHHLIHKAVGWMLREIGNRDFQVEYGFLEQHYRKMPRIMLRYAIEKFEPELRQKFLTGQI